MAIFSSYFDHDSESARLGAISGDNLLESRVTRWDRSSVGKKAGRSLCVCDVSIPSYLGTGFNRGVCLITLPNLVISKGSHF